MSEMVDRVAGALVLAGANLQGIDENDYVGGRVTLAGLDARELARAAIAAMREPTRGMIEAAYNTNEGVFPESDFYCMDKVWEAMINAALEPSSSASEPGTAAA
jgi:hypothetical protein